MHPYDDLLIDTLLDQGFTLEEAERLLSLQDRMERTNHQDRRHPEYHLWIHHNRWDDCDKNA